MKCSGFQWGFGEPPSYADAGGCLLSDLQGDGKATNTREQEEMAWPDPAPPQASLRRQSRSIRGRGGDTASDCVNPAAIPAARRDRAHDEAKSTPAKPFLSREDAQR